MCCPCLRWLHACGVPPPVECGEKRAPFALANGRRGAAGDRRERRGSGSSRREYPGGAGYCWTTVIYSWRTARGSWRELL
eukprot:scaffold125553_cov28-Tisochrysis_lutea.AAC.2